LLSADGETLRAGIPHRLLILQSLRDHKQHGTPLDRHDGRWLADCRVTRLSVGGQQGTLITLAVELAWRIDAPCLTLVQRRCTLIDIKAGRREALAALDAVGQQIPGSAATRVTTSGVGACVVAAAVVTRALVHIQATRVDREDGAGGASQVKLHGTALRTVEGESRRAGVGYHVFEGKRPTCDGDQGIGGSG